MSLFLFTHFTSGWWSGGADGDNGLNFLTFAFAISLILMAFTIKHKPKQIGFGVAKLGSSLIGLGVTGQPLHSHLPPSGFKARIKHIGLGIVTWGSSKIQKLIWYLRWPIFFYGGFVALLVFIHLASPDPRFTTFPHACPESKWLGCSRIAKLAPQGNHKLQPLHVDARLVDVQTMVEIWISMQPNAVVLHSSPGFVHARFVTMVFGFADDFLVQLRCSKDDTTIVEAHGQLRIGKSDLGVNYRRNKRFYEMLSEVQFEGDSKACSASAE